MMKINIHAGHNPDGMIACGAVGFLKESTEARIVKNLVVNYLKEQGHTVYDCTCDNGTSQQDVLNKIIRMCNSNKVDLDVSIHFNSCVNDLNGDGRTTGTEVYIYDEKTCAKKYAQQTVNAISELGFTNRGVKINVNLRVLRETAAPAMLIECCFVDDRDDAILYNSELMAMAIVKGITGQLPQTVPTKASVLYRVQVGAFRNRDNAENYEQQLEKDGYVAFLVEVEQ